ncbi:MAG: C-GCAxxG-C-C family protein [Pseudomonadota bacterium]
MTRSERAESLFKDGFTCSQSVLSVFAHDFGLEQAPARKLSAGFGGGMGRMGMTCGAATGAIMVIGLAHGAASGQDKDAKLKTHGMVRRFVEEFQRRHGYLTCKELLDGKLSKPEDYESPQGKELVGTVCPKLVADAVAILEGMLRAGA